MMQPSLPEPPPPGTDAFDEESCRYFLREVGEQVVPYYPFSFGIHEVYSILVERYGHDCVADALSVLQELLEGEDNASGLGDDGDIWRSWRHSWRHRNDDPLNPCIPKVHGFVLPLPTPRKDRLARAANFSALGTDSESTRRLDEATETDIEEILKLPSPLSHSSYPDNGACINPSSRPQTGCVAAPVHTFIPSQAVYLTRSSILPEYSTGKEMDVVPCLEHISPAHKVGTDCYVRQSAEIGELREGKTEDIPSEDTDSEQEFDEVRQWANSIDFDSSQLISFEIFRPLSSSQHSAAGLRGDGVEIYTIRPVRTPTPTRNSPLLTIQYRKQSPPGVSDQISDKAVTGGDENAPERELDAHAKASYRYSTVGEGTMGMRQNSLPEWSTVLPPGNFPERDSSVGTSRAVTGQFHMSSRRGSPTQRLWATNNWKGRGGASTSPIQPVRRSSTNREARLIDGAIFTPKIPEIAESVLNQVDGKAGGAECGKSSVRASWSGVRQKHHSQHSWMHSVRGIFQKDCPNKQSPSHTFKKATIKDNKYAEQGHSTDMYPSHETSSDRAFNLSKQYHRTDFRLALDGTCDDRSSPYPVNLNKALPPKPKISGIHKPPSLQPATPSFDHSQDTTDRPSTASTASSGFSASSSKREFRNLTQALVNEDTGAYPTELSPVSETKSVHGPHTFDPPRSAKSEYSEFSFTSVVNGNPFSGNLVPLTAMMPLPLSTRKQEDAAKQINGRGMPQSRSEPSFQPSTPKQADYPIPSYLSPAPVRKSPQKDGIDSSTARGRSPQQHPAPPQFQQAFVEDPIFASKGKPRKRSRSPVKKLLGFGKSSSLKNVVGELQHHPDEMLSEKRELKTWGNRLRHGFLSSETEPNTKVEEQTPSSKLTANTKSVLSPPQHSTFPVSLDPPYQAKILSEIELMICVTANRYLMHEYKAGRLSASSVAKTNEQWARKNRPQVIEFSYDQSTQRELVIANLNTIQIHGESAENAVVFNTTMYNWNSLAKDMAVRTFCSPDSAIRKHMHDAHKILETLGAPLVTFLAFQDLQVKTLGKMADKQRERMERDIQQHTPGKRVDTPVSKLGHTPKFSQSTIESSPSPSFHKAYDAYENSRGGRLGMMVRDM